MMSLNMPAPRILGAPAGTVLGVIARVPVKLRMKGQGRTVIQNERKSPFELAGHSLVLNG